MQLVEQGKLDLNEPTAKYSPEFQQRFGRGTVRHVFTHTSHDPSGDTYLYDGYRFSFLTEVGGHKSTYAHQMKGARFTIPRSALLAKVVDLMDVAPPGRTAKFRRSRPTSHPWHGRLPRRGGRVPARAPPEPAARREAQEALPRAGLRTLSKR